MRLIAIIVFLALLTMPCIAVPDSVTTGPYKISFDLGISKEAYKVDVVTPEVEESLSGELSTKYRINLINKTGISRTSIIYLYSYETDQVIPTQSELVQGVKSTLTQNNGMYDVQAAGRKIDGFDGAAGSGTIYRDYGTYEQYTAIYFPSSTMMVLLMSSYPWDEGTLSLLKTIHVEKINTTS